jgi:hypothetical protein
MKRYRVKDVLIFGFDDGRYQSDAYVEPGDELETDGSTIWVTWVKGDQRQRAESITMAYAINIFLEKGLIEEIV